MRGQAEHSVLKQPLRDASGCPRRRCVCRFLEATEQISLAHNNGTAPEYGFLTGCGGCFCGPSARRQSHRFDLSQLTSSHCMHCIWIASDLKLSLINARLYHGYNLACLKGPHGGQCASRRGGTNHSGGTRQFGYNRKDDFMAMKLQSLGML